MIKMSIWNRLILLITGHLAGYEVVKGIEGYDIWVTVYFTISFGVLILACLLLILFGFELLDNDSVAVISTLIPLGISLGIIKEYYPELHITYVIFAIAGFILIIITRIFKKGKLDTIVLSVVHGIAGLIVFIIPIVLSITGTTKSLFSLVGVGGALIGIGGMLLAFLRTGKPILSKETIYNLFPLLLLVMTALFVSGLSAF